MLLSSPIRAAIGPFRAVSIRVLAVKYNAQQSFAGFFSRSVSASITVLSGQVRFMETDTPGKIRLKESKGRR